MSHLFDDNSGRDWKKFWYHARSAFAVLLSLAVLLGGAWFVTDKANNAWQSYRTASDYVGANGVKDIQVTIPAGASGYTIGDLLVDKDVIKSRKAFLKAYDKNELASTIQAGTYKLRTQIPASVAIDMLLDKKNIVRNLVTVPEGMWNQDQFALLSRKTKIPVAQFQKAAEDPQALGLPEYAGDSTEGYLYPSTYEIGQKPTATSILKLMAQQFNKEADKLELEKGAEELDRKPSEVMVVASILEAEALEKDMPTVAGIIYNRLEQGMPLQLDSTSHYGLKIPNNEPLPAGFKDDWEPYNTYQISGLPPTPITNPGEAAIKAALNPKKSDYLYWLTTNFKTGETKFAKTYDDHLKNEQEWIAWCKQAKDKSGCPVG